MPSNRYAVLISGQPNKKLWYGLRSRRVQAERGCHGRGVEQRRKHVRHMIEQYFVLGEDGKQGQEFGAYLPVDAAKTDTLGEEAVTRHERRQREYLMSRSAIPAKNGGA